MIGSIEAFDIADNPAPFFSRYILPLEKLGETHICPMKIFQLFQRREHIVHLAPTIAQRAVFKADLRSTTLIGLQSGLIDEREQLRGPAVDELRAQLDRLVAHMLCQNSPANSILNNSRNSCKSNPGIYVFAVIAGGRR